MSTLLVYPSHRHAAKQLEPQTQPYPLARGLPLQGRNNNNILIYNKPCDFHRVQSSKSCKKTTARQVHRAHTIRCKVRLHATEVTINFFRYYHCYSLGCSSRSKTDVTPAHKATATAATASISNCYSNHGQPQAQRASHCPPSTPLKL